MSKHSASASFACSTRATVSGGTSIPGTLVATNRMPPTVRRMQIEGISAIRSLSPVSAAARMNRSSSSGR